MIIDKINNNNILMIIQQIGEKFNLIFNLDYHKIIIIIIMKRFFIYLII